MKKILYIDNKQYGHNADLHIEFIASLDDQINFKIIGYGNFLKGYIKNTYQIPLKSANKKYGIHQDIDIKKSDLELDKILKIHKPDLILTYNSNGSSYEVGLDNINLYSWISEKLSKLDIPKYHITTDYCRSGFRQDQSEWFEEVGYTGAIFRHKESLKYPISVPKYWLPFSVNASRYQKNIEINMDKKDKKVGFVGAAHNSAVELYSQRIAAIDFLISKSMLRTTQVVGPNFERKIVTGEAYVKFLTGNMFNLTCGGTCNFFTAKYIQIPASYSMLICANTNGLELFPKETYIEYSITNLNKLYDDIIFHLNNKSIIKEKINILHNYVIKNFNYNKSKKILIDNIIGY